MGPEPATASVTVDDVREVINVSSAEVPDAEIAKMVKRAEVTLERKLAKKSTTAIALKQKKSSSQFSPPSIQFVILQADLL